MKTKNKFMKDFSAVLFSNGLVLVSNILSGLVIPKLLGVADYGYYKIFTLYLGYTALLHFGFVDGILLNHGGEQYTDLNQKKFRLNSQFFIIFQAIISVIVIIIALTVAKGIYKFLFVMIGVDTITTNVTSYYQYISQCTMRFKELSIRRFLQALLKIFVTVILFGMIQIGAITHLSCQLYVGVLILIDVVLLLWYVYTYRDITFGEREKLAENIDTIRKYFTDGIILTIAFQVANLVFSLDRQFVSLLFDTETYAVYSFAYTLISMVTTVIGAISLVLFPNLKRKSEDKIISEFSNSMALIAILVYAAQIGYYPLCGFIKWFLPEYQQSIQYLGIVFPGLAVSSCISTIIFTYYKVLDQNLKYFKICAGILGLSVVSNGIAYWCFRTPMAISVASVITLLVWYLVGERYFITRYKVKWKKNLLYILVMGIIFYAVINNVIFGNIWSSIIYTVMFGIVTLLFYRKTLVQYIVRR